MRRSVSDVESEHWQLGRDALYLAGCALHGKTARWNPEKDLTALYSFCKFHSITAIVAMALEDYWKENPPADPAIMKPWKQEKEQNIRKNILLNAEREEILRQLEAMGCWYMPLKGSLLQYDYPRFGMRQMSDNDILIDKNFRRAVRDMMCGRGYEVRSYQMGAEDNYIKPPVYNYEMHADLFFKAWEPVLGGYYETIREKMQKDSDNQFGYHLSDEDFYVYVMAHAYRHFNGSGTGIRILLDVWTFGRKRPNLDWEYITGELTKLGAAEFESGCRALAGKMFDTLEAGELSDTEEALLAQLLRAGTYGLEQIKVEHRLEKSGSRTAYLLSRAFPSVDYLSIMYPFLPKHRWLLPVMWIWRLVTRIFTVPAKLIWEFKSLNKQE